MLRVVLRIFNKILKHGLCYRMNFVLPPNSYVKVLILVPQNVTVFGGKIDLERISVEWPVLKVSPGNREPHWSLYVFFFESLVLNFLILIQNLKLWLFRFSRTLCLLIYEEH